MDWNEIMKIENPHKALKAIAHKIDVDTLSITEMEERIYEYAKIHDIDIDEMAFYPNGGRVLDPDDILTIQYEELLENEQILQEGANFSKGEMLPYYVVSEIANRARSIGKTYLQTYQNFINEKELSRLERDNLLNNLYHVIHATELLNEEKMVVDSYANPHQIGSSIIISSSIYASFAAEEGEMLRSVIHKLIAKTEERYFYPKFRYLHDMKRIVRHQEKLTAYEAIINRDYLNYVQIWAKSVNHRKISYYTLDGKLKEQQDLKGDNIGNTNGMMIRCFMQNGTICEGFSDPYRTHGEPPYDGNIHDFIYLWTWDHLDEQTHKLVGDNTTKFDQTFVPVPIHEIIRIDAILYSNPRWGGKLFNHFFVNTSQDVAKDAEK